MSRLLVIASLVLVLIAAGCGGDSSDDDASTAAGSGSTLEVAGTDIGEILVGADGRSLYLFEKDTGPKSTCSGECAGAWPPFTVTGRPQAGSEVDPAKLSTSKRADGKLQVVYAGHPLYYYAGDQDAGDTKGQDLNEFGAEWYAVSPTGEKVIRSDPSSEDSSGGGSSY